MAVVGLTDPCPVHALLVHLGESRPQPLDTVPFSCLTKVARRLPVLFSDPRRAHHVVPGPCPASVDSKCNEGRSRWETFEFQLRTYVCIYTTNEMYAELYNMATVSRLQLFSLSFPGSCVRIERESEWGCHARSLALPNVSGSHGRMLTVR